MVIDLSRIFVTGDVHGDSVGRLSTGNFPKGKDLNRDDLVFIAGDFGTIWAETPQTTKAEQYTLDWLETKPFTVMVVGGNHENWDRLRSLPIVEKFGVKLGEIRSNVFFVPNGTLIEYAGKKIFCFGGAMSTDRGGLEPGRVYLEEGISWWRGEIPTKEEMDFGLDNLEKAGNKVDIIITHTMPVECIDEFVMINGYHKVRTEDPTAKFLSFVRENTEYDKWFCGHFHCDHLFWDNVQCLYHGIVDATKKGYYDCSTRLDTYSDSWY